VTDTESGLLSSGWFRVERELAITTDARVFLCSHLPAHRAYLLRIPPGLSSATPAPLSSTQNSGLELGNVRGTAAAAAALYRQRYFGKERAHSDTSLVVPEYYGVVDSRYLMPASATYRRRGAVGFDAVTAISDLLVRMTPFWENLSLLVSAETSLMAGGSISYDAWESRWRRLLRGSSLGRDLLAHPPDGVQGRMAAQIAELVDDTTLGPGPALEDSTVLRLMVAVATRRLTDEQVKDALSCPFLRMNITIHDLTYAVALLNLLQPQDWLLQSPVEWLGPTLFVLPTITDGLVEQPATFPDDAPAFEPCPPPDDATLGRFEVFVQDPERTVRPYLALERA